MDLVEIAQPATAENAALQLHPADNVAVARVPLAPGQVIRVAGREVLLGTPVPAGHKVALQAIPAGGNVLRYGQFIGLASRPVAPGEHIHTHNIAYEEIALQYEFPAGEVRMPAPPREMPVFMGYPREDGRVGTRNYIAVAAASNCASHVAEQVAAHFAGSELPPNVDGVVAFPHAEGCGHHIGPDTEQLQRTISGILDHPNVAAGVILGLGCEINLIEHYFEPGAARSAKLAGMTIQATGGTRATVAAGVAEVRAQMEHVSGMKRVETPASKIVLGLNCGGSDSFSGITANPALGACSDLLAAIGATAVLAETPEIVGAEHLLVRRARNRAVAEKLLDCIRWYKEYLIRAGGNFDDNPSPGNKEGGLTNITEKSLGAVAKGGTSTLVDVVQYAERIQSPGFVFMNTPGYDPVSITGLAAGGVNLIAFTTGRGSAIGFPTVPVIKIATNSGMYRRMRDNMDINAGRIMEGEATVGEVGREIFEFLLEAASGRRTCAERLGHREFVPWRIGPVL